MGKKGSTVFRFTVFAFWFALIRKKKEKKESLEWRTGEYSLCVPCLQYIAGWILVVDHGTQEPEVVLTQCADRYR